MTSELSGNGPYCRRRAYRPKLVKKMKHSYDHSIDAEFNAESQNPIHFV